MAKLTPAEIEAREKTFGYKGNYGLEMAMDLKGCDLTVLTQEKVGKFMVDLCDFIDMKRHGDPMYWVDDSGVKQLEGISAIQFVETSNVVFHGLPIMKAVYLNIFSCKAFDPEKTLKFCMDYWGATEEVHTVLVRT